MTDGGLHREGDDLPPHSVQRSRAARGRRWGGIASVGADADGVGEGDPAGPEAPGVERGDGWGTPS